MQEVTIAHMERLTIKLQAALETIKATREKVASPPQDPLPEQQDTFASLAAGEVFNTEHLARLQPPPAARPPPAAGDEPFAGCEPHPQP